MLLGIDVSIALYDHWTFVRLLFIQCNMHEWKKVLCMVIKVAINMNNKCTFFEICTTNQPMRNFIALSRLFIHSFFVVLFQFLHRSSIENATKKNNRVGLQRNSQYFHQMLWFRLFVFSAKMCKHLSANYFDCWLISVYIFNSIERNWITTIGEKSKKAELSRDIETRVDFQGEEELYAKLSK